MIVADLCILAEQLCRAVAPLDLGDTPLYVLAQSTLASEYGSAEGCYAFTESSGDLYFRDAIGAAWRGLARTGTVHRRQRPGDSSGHGGARRAAVRDGIYAA